MTWRCARLWTAAPSGGLPTPPAPTPAAAPPSLRPPPSPQRTETRRPPCSAWWRTSALSCPALRPWSAAYRAAFAPSPPPATTDPPHPVRWTGPSRRLPPRAGRRRTKAGSRLTEVRWLRLVILTQTRTCRSWCPAWTRWRISWGKEARRRSARRGSLPLGRGERETHLSLNYIKSVIVVNRVKSAIHFQIFHNKSMLGNVKLSWDRFNLV